MTIQMLTDEQVTKAVANELCRRGIGATDEHMGGWIFCVLVNLEDAGYFIFGMSDMKWAGDAYRNEHAFDEGENSEGRIATDVPSDSQDVKAIADAVHAGLNAHVGHEVAFSISGEKN